MQRPRMNLATQYRDQSVNRFSFETLPVGVLDHASRAVAKREPDIRCQISGLEKEP